MKIKENKSNRILKVFLCICMILCVFSVCGCHSSSSSKSSSKDASKTSQNDASNSSNKDTEKQKTPSTNYALYAGSYEPIRADVSWGVFNSDKRVYTAEQLGMTNDFIVLTDTGGVSFSLYGVTFNGSYTLGKDCTVTYGNTPTPAKEMNINGENKNTAYIGAVIAEFWMVGNTPYVLLNAESTNPANHKSQTMWMYIISDKRLEQ